jgi:hypothetical protein
MIKEISLAHCTAGVSKEAAEYVVEHEEEFKKITAPCYGSWICDPVSVLHVAKQYLYEHRQEETASTERQTRSAFA